MNNQAMTRDEDMVKFSKILKIKIKGFNRREMISYLLLYFKKG
jgi:hypothetical protein